MLAVLLGLVVILVVRPAGRLDQADLAYQRDGLLRTGPTVPAEVAGVRFGDRPAVLLFVRERPTAQRLTPWLAGIPNDVDTYVVVQSGQVGRGSVGADVRTVDDPSGQLAEAVDLPASNDGGPGIGYAVIDRDGIVRYSTLDPRWYDNAFEVATIVGAIA